MRQLGIFAKYWQPGAVKTRLAGEIGLEAAAALHREFLATSLIRFADRADRTSLVFTPESQRDEIAAALPASTGWELQCQSAGHLGQRMQVFFDAAFAAGATQVALIGSDTPHLPPDFLDRAFQLLDRKDVVLGPSDDGGYYLVAASRSTPPIFGPHDWGSARVYDQTLAALAAAAIDYDPLPLWYDIDTPDDLARLHAELALASDPHLARLRRRIEEIGSKP